MVYDDLIIGSGLSALATAYGLCERNRVCVLAGSARPELQWYDKQSRIPCSNNGQGGLGVYWHGVIPMGQPSAFFDADRALFEELFSLFYPEPLDERFGRPWLFVPYRPIRPAQHWRKICSERANFSMSSVKADRFERANGFWNVFAGNECYQARRIWLGAGALATPTLLENSPEFSGSARSHLSDHVILYLGRLDRKLHPQVPTPQIERKATGVWMLANYDSTGSGLITTKPARFSYAKLDHGIEQRSAFGLPTTGLMAKVLSAGSLGLISESLFNKLGLFPDADQLNAYAQIRIGDAYEMSLDQSGIKPDVKKIQQDIQKFRASLDWSVLEPSRKPALFIRGIHLHNSVDMALLEQSGSLSESNFFIVDPSGISDIGLEHHSFKVMVRAYSLAKASQK